MKMKSRSNVATVSTGDDEKDRQEIARTEMFNDRIAAGVCPNGCADLGFTTPFVGNCPACGFILSTNVPYGRRIDDDAPAN